MSLKLQVENYYKVPSKDPASTRKAPLDLGFTEIKLFFFSLETRFRLKLTKPNGTLLYTEWDELVRSTFVLKA